LAGYNESITQEEISGSGGMEMTQLLFIANAGKQIRDIMTGKNPKDRRYTESEEQLALLFDSMTRELDPETRRRMMSGQEDALTLRIINSVAGREKAKLRNEELFKVVVLPDSALEAEVSSSLFPQGLNGNNQTVEDDRVVKEVLRSMDPTFKKKFAYIAVNGSQEDKIALKNSIIGYSSQDNIALGAELFDRLEKNNLKNDRVREILRENGQIEEILNAFK
jgi:hypothetical protein